MIGIGAALLGSAGASAGSSILSTILNAKFASGENELDRLTAENLTRMQQSNALQQMNLQHKFETRRYQDLVSDLEAAGLNPASAFGSVGSTPSSSIAGAGIGSGSHGSNRLGANLDFGSSAFNSAISYLASTDKTALNKLSNALVNTAIDSAKENSTAEAFKEKTLEDYMKEWSKYK